MGMNSAMQFLEYAAQCLDWAKTAKDEKDRAAFVHMANSWIEVASRVTITESRPND
jgi:hypothetical protein